MTGQDFFNAYGHLTNYALTTLISGEPDELARLELAEHLSFCDECTERYTALLCDEALLQPPEPLAPTVMKRLRQQAHVIFLNRYFSAGLAASLAIIFWVTGVFSPSLEQDGLRQLERLNSLTTFSDRLSERTTALGSGITEGINEFFDNFNLKGDQPHEKE